MSTLYLRYWHQLSSFWNSRIIYMPTQPNTRVHVDQCVNSLCMSSVSPWRRSTTESTENIKIVATHCHNMLTSLTYVHSKDVHSLWNSQHWHCCIPCIYVHTTLQTMQSYTYLTDASTSLQQSKPVVLGVRNTCRRTHRIHKIQRDTNASPPPYTCGHSENSVHYIYT